MVTNDFINGLFEFVGGLFFIINIVKLVKDKTVKGVSWIPTTFFTLWGAWNLIYYHSLHQTFSFIGGICIFTTNAIWVFLVFYYKRKNI